MRRPVAVAAALAAAGVVLLSSARADDSGGCSAFKWPINREQSAFAGEGLPTVQAGAQIPGIMEAVSLKLAKQDGQTFEVQPSRKPTRNPAYAGVFPVPPIQVAGPYNVTISAEAWIDAIQGGKVLHQTGFTGAKDCPNIRKSVRFDFAPGPATIMITDAATDRLMLELLPPPP